MSEFIESMHGFGGEDDGFDPKAEHPERAYRLCKLVGCNTQVWGLGTASPDEPRFCTYHEGWHDALRHLAEVAQTTRERRERAPGLRRAAIKKQAGTATVALDDVMSAENDARSAWLSDVLDQHMPLVPRHAKDALCDAILASEWLRERDRMVREAGWDEGWRACCSFSGRTWEHVDGWTDTNPYRVTPRPVGRLCTSTQINESQPRST